MGDKNASDALLNRTLSTATASRTTRDTRAAESSVVGTRCRRAAEDNSVQGELCARWR